MAEPHETPASVETMAFQVLLQKMAVHEQKLSNVEQAMQQMPLLLTRIIEHLEAQTTHPDVPIATYDQMYAKFLETSAEEAEEQDSSVPVIELAPLPTVRRHRIFQWFVRET